MKHKRNFAIIFIFAILLTLLGYLADPNSSIRNSITQFTIICAGFSFMFSMFYVLYWALYMTYWNDASDEKEAQSS